MSELHRRLAPELPRGRNVGPKHILDLACRIVIDRQGWRPGWQAHDVNGAQCAMLQRRARYFSCEGAICRAASELAASVTCSVAAVRVFRLCVDASEYDSSAVREWEQAAGRTVEEVHAAFRDALDRARATDAAIQTKYGVDLVA